MKKILLLGKWGREVDDAGMKHTEDWRAEMSEREGWMEWVEKSVRRAL